MINQTDRFEELMKSIRHSYEFHLIDGNTLDLITNSMTQLFIEEARLVAIENGDLSESDGDEFVFAEIEPLFEKVSDKTLFNNELERVFYLTKKVFSVSEMVELVRDERG